MSEELHDVHLLGPLVLHLTEEAFNLVKVETEEQFKKTDGIPRMDDVLSAVLNRMAADLLVLAKHQIAPPYCPICGYRH